MRLLFQFQSGAVKSAQYESVAQQLNYFNSKVVRLKDVSHSALDFLKENFNSNVVRLKENARTVTNFVTAISIPKWCG